MAAALCGKAERLKAGYTLAETGQDAHVSLLTGRPTAHRPTVSATKTYSLVLDYVFQPKIFAERQNAQEIALPYDGLNPQPPTYCLKPYYLKRGPRFTPTRLRKPSRASRPASCRVESSCHTTPFVSRLATPFILCSSSSDPMVAE
jgi:hypothetical protein